MSNLVTLLESALAARLKRRRQSAVSTVRRAVRRRALQTLWILHVRASALRKIAEVEAQVERNERPKTVGGTVVFPGSALYAALDRGTCERRASRASKRLARAQAHREEGEQPWISEADSVARLPRPSYCYFLNLTKDSGVYIPTLMLENPGRGTIEVAAFGRKWRGRLQTVADQIKRERHRAWEEKEKLSEPLFWRRLEEGLYLDEREREALATADASIGRKISREARKRKREGKRAVPIGIAEFGLWGNMLGLRDGERIETVYQSYFPDKPKSKFDAWFETEGTRFDLRDNWQEGPPLVTRLLDENHPHLDHELENIARWQSDSSMKGVILFPTPRLDLKIDYYHDSLQ